MKNENKTSAEKYSTVKDQETEEPRSTPVTGAVAPSLQPATPARVTLRPGAAGPAVAAAQGYLGARGFTAGATDGVFGAWLERALRHYQNYHGIPETGELDEATWGLIDSGK